MTMRCDGVRCCVAASADPRIAKVLQLLLCSEQNIFLVGLARPQRGSISKVRAAQEGRRYPDAVLAKRDEFQNGFTPGRLLPQVADARAVSDFVDQSTHAATRQHDGAQPFWVGKTLKSSHCFEILCAAGVLFSQSSCDFTQPRMMWSVVLGCRCALVDMLQRIVAKSVGIWPIHPRLHATGRARLIAARCLHCACVRGREFCSLRMPRRADIL